MRWSLRPVAPFFAFAVCLATPLVFAQAPEEGDAQSVARQRYKAGMDAWQSKRYVEAALQFEAAAEQKANAAALFMAASSWELVNAPERAADDYSRALAVPGLPPENAATAKARLSALEAVLGRAEVTAPSGWRVQLDSNTEVPTPAVLHGSAGVHALAIRAPDRPIERRQVVLQVGQATSVALTNEAPPAASSSAAGSVEPPPEAPRPKPVVVQADESFFARARKPAGFVAIGVGAAALAAGAIVGTQALNARDAYNGAPTRAGFDHASSLQSWTNVMLIGGGVVAAAGVALVLWPSAKAEPSTTATPAKVDTPKDKEAARLSIVPTLGGAALRGSF